MNSKDFLFAQKRKKAVAFGGIILAFIGISFLVNFLKNINSGLNITIPSFPFGKPPPLLFPFPEEPGFGFLERLKEETVKKEIGFTIFSPLGENAIEASTGAGATVFFSKKKDLKLQLDTLQTIWENFKIEGRRVKIIDLRYERPIITP